MDQAFSNLAMDAKLLGTCPVSRMLSGRPARWLRMWPNNPRTVIFPLGRCTLLECLAIGQIAQIPGCKLSLRSHTHAPQTPIPHSCRQSPRTLNSTRGGFSVARFRSSTLTIAATSAKIQSRCPAFSKFGGFCRVTIWRADVKPFVCRHRPGRPYLPGSEHQPRAADHHFAVPTTTGPTNPRIFLVSLLVDSGRICVQRFAGPSLVHCLGLSDCQIRVVEQDQGVCSIPRPSKICGPAGTVVVFNCLDICLCSCAGSTASPGL